MKFYWGTSAHVAFLPPSAATACPLCHGALARRGDRMPPASCERCGQPFHYKCYVAALPPGPERDFFTGPDTEPCPIFLCGGCRS